MALFARDTSPNPQQSSSANAATHTPRTHGRGEVSPERKKKTYSGQVFQGT